MADLELLQRILAADYVPTGKRVNIYQKLSVLSEIENALDDEERKFIYNSQFGKLFEISQKPAWSGAFALFTLTRMLEVEKDNEIWVLFAGKPIRFSLREFKIVTGLCCGKYPPSGKKRRRSNGEHFYEQLFGGARDVSAEKVLQMLQSWSVNDRETRLRYACLLIVDAILLPSFHFPRVKIDVDHAEMVEDINAFVAYPWGRVSYEIIMESLLTRDFAQFATANVVVQGFVPAIQMVVLEAAPAILEDSDVSEDEDFVSRRGGQKLQLSMTKIRSLDEKDEVEVEMIIRPELEFNQDDEDLSWSEDDEDPKVDHMIKSYNQGMEFSQEIFGPGLTAEELATRSKKKRVIRKAKGAASKKGKGKLRKPSVSRSAGESSASVGIDLNAIGSLFDTKIGELASMVEANLKKFLAAQIKELSTKIESVAATQSTVNNKLIVDGVTEWFKKNVIVEEVVDISDGARPSPAVNQSGRPAQGNQPAEDNQPVASHSIPKTPGPAQGHVANSSIPKSSAQSRGIGNEELSVEDITAIYSDIAAKDAPSETVNPTNVPTADNIVNNEPMTVTFEHGESTEHTAFDGDHINDGIFSDNNVGVNNQGVADVLIDENNLATQGGMNSPPSILSEETSEKIPTAAPTVDKTHQTAVLEDSQTEVPPTTHSNVHVDILPVGKDDVIPVSATLPQGDVVARTAIPDRGSQDADIIDAADDGGRRSDLVIDKALRKEDGNNASDLEVRRKSKRTKFASTKLDNRFICDKDMKRKVCRHSPVGGLQDGVEEYEESIKSLKRTLSVGDGIVLQVKDVTDIIGREKCMLTKLSTHVMDALVKLSRHLLKVDDRKPRVEVLDTKFVSSLVKLYPRFSKAVNRDAYQFSKPVVEKLVGVGEGGRQHLFTEVDILYLPFNLDGKHWVFLAVHLCSSKIEVIDCNVQLRTDVSMHHELLPIAVMFPYLCRQVGGNESMAKMPLTQMTIERATGIQQLTSPNDSGLCSIFLMQAHAIGGIEQCRLIDPSDLEIDARKLITVLIEVFNN
ncbi:uncharacterized protein LOC112081434 [Eutrema salsugineum]|uniref:uncharacterized protein LOC112081434 n=1 Tax=Eutrema salsugineum TaxID=72664 RepID=UPI000CED460B|nr:uncharacterized protein LOC112081434 [Eutrema salsugineum]